MDYHGTTWRGPENDGSWLNTREASRRLGLPVRTVYRLIDEGQLPAYRSGSDIGLRPDDVETYRASQGDPGQASAS